MDIKKVPAAMWIRPENAVVIHPSQLAIGLYVWLDIPWDAHPFLYNKFRIASAEQIAEIRALNLESIKFFPNKSTAQPGEMVAETVPVEPVQPMVLAEAVAAPLSDIDRLKEEKRAKLQRQKDAAARADRGWERTAKATREALLGLARSPRQAGQQIATLSHDIASTIATGEEVLLHLLGDKQGDGPQFHAINVMTLSLLVGKVAGLDEKALTDLAMAAVAHDAGKARVPAYLLKARVRAKHEEAVYRQHTDFGTELARESGAFSPEAITAIADHHECIDGSGWPGGKTAVGTFAQILCLINRYDRLCGPESPENTALMPRDALATLFSKESAKFDPKLVSALVRLLGVFPPGTIVQLTDGSLGLVVSPGKESLRPKVLIYSPEGPKDEAPIVDLGEQPELKIEEALRPASIPADVMSWLNPRQRLSYFFSTETST